MIDKKAKQRLYAAIAIFVVVIIIGSGLFVYFEYFNKEKKVNEKEEPVVIDDRISPLENQAVIFEVLRIRHRGLYDRLMTPGNSWKNKPSFYFNIELDGVSYSSKDVVALRASGELLFNTWDTMFQENKIMRDAAEEQEKSEITLTLMERVKTGLLGRRTTDIERDKFSVIYDYRTGRWTGDDYFMDYDGYGHYLGDTFEVWFNVYQTDYDRDYIPYWTEVNILHTDPMRSDLDKDPDGDGIPTTWEWKWGYDPNSWDDHEKLDPDIDGLENIEEYQMEKWLADPFAQDVYVEIDYMERGGIFDPPHIFYEESQQAIIEKYSEHNIQVFFDMGWPDTPQNGGGEVLPHVMILSQDSGMLLQYYKHHFPDERKGIFRYVLVGDTGAFNHPSTFNVYDCVFICYSVRPKALLKQMLIPYWRIPPTQRAQRIKVAATLMHEMGHSVGIHPWTFEGCDNLTYLNGKAAMNTYKDTWGQYMSVMNYYNIYKINLLDYSDGKNGAPYDQNDWLNLFIPTFEYNADLVEEIYFEPPGFNKIVWGETETGVTGYTYDKNLTEKYEKEIKDFSPVDPIKANWLVFKIDDNYKEKNPNFSEIKVLVSPDVPYAGWALYSEGNLDANGDFRFYSFNALVKEKTK